MSKKRRMVLIASLVMGMTAGSVAAATLAGCKPRPEVTIDDVTGTYYGEANGKECEIELVGSSFTFSLTVDGTVKQGEYSYDGTNLNLRFSDNTTIVANLTKSGEGNKYVLKIEYEGTSFVLNEGAAVKYTVSFKYGEEVLGSKNVVEGKKVSKIDAPTKTGLVFVGWYEDAAFKTAFDFSNKTITGTTTIYARYVTVDASKSVYEVKFYDGETVASSAMQTINGVIYELPTLTKSGSTFAGWWVSDYNDANKLTYKYEGQELKQNTTLFAVWESNAPLVSVTSTGVKWTAKGTNNNYEVVITLPDGTEDRLGSQSTTSLTYDFSASGEYVISVTLRGQTTKVYLNNKALARVSAFEVEGNLLKFTGVDNAEKYLITVICGDENHFVADYDLGSSTEYNFSGCQMNKDGIKFIVKACAEGYGTSVSEVYSFVRNLGSVKNLSVDSTTDTVTWDAVDNAVYYVVAITQGDKTEEFRVSAANAAKGYSLGAYSGYIKIKVYPVATGYNSPEAAEISYNKVKLAVPQNLTNDGLQVSWSAVPNAKGYIVKVGDKVVGEVEGTSYTLTDAHFTDGIASVTVSAKGTYDYENSLFSTALIINKRIFSAPPVYSNGGISWGAVLDAAYYEVKVNDGNPVKVEVATASEVVLTKKGNNEVSVRCVYKDGGYSDWNSTTVVAYSVKIDKNNGEDVIEVFKAANDEFDLQDAAWTGYTFTGWYENGNKFDSLVYPERDIELTAAYKANKYTVTLKLDNGDVFGTKEVTFGEAFNLSVPESEDTTKTFGGWRLEAGGQGTQYTNPEGYGLRVWNIAANTDLHVSWIDVFRFTLSNTGDEYIVSKGIGISYVTDIKIPAKYNNLPVTIVETGAFENCSNLVSIALPNTIQTVAMGVDGGNGKGSAFVGCTSLKSVTVYEVEGFNPAAAYFYSSDGVLIYKNPTSYEVEIKYFPYAKDGKYSVPYGVTQISTGVFKNAKITEIEIPASVKEINSSAFDSCRQLEKVSFLPATEGQTEQSLKLSKGAFESCSSLKSFDLPKRLTEFDMDAIGYAPNLKKINVEDGGELFSSDDGVIIKNIDGKKVIYYCPRYREEIYKISDPSIDTIGAASFKNCSKLNEIVIPEWITSIETEAFRGCSAVQTLTFEGRGDSVDLAIGEYAFYGCTALKQLILPENLTALGKSAFGSLNVNEVTINCVRQEVRYDNNAFASDSGNTSSITTVNLGAQVPKMDLNGVFGGMSLEKVNVDPANPNYKSEDGVIYDNAFREIVFYPSGRKGEFVLKESVERIGASVFEGKLNLTTITIGNNVKEISEGAFRNCENLASVIFKDDDGAASLVLAKEAFAGCTALKDLNLPTRLTEIGEGAFRLKDSSYVVRTSALVIPEGVTKIGRGAFGGWNMESFHISSTVTELGMMVCDDNAYNNGNSYLGVTASEWYYDSAKTMSVENLNTDIFYTKSGGNIIPYSLATITVAEGNQNFGVYNGMLCVKKDGNLTEVLISPRKNTGVDSVITIPNTVTVIHDLAFSSNQNITELKFEEGRTSDDISLGSGVFNGANKLTKISLPSGLKTIASGMFKGCSLIEEIFIPNTVTFIGVNAFKGCTNLSKVKFESGGTEELKLEAGNYKDVDEYGTKITQVNTVFTNCKSLNTLTLPERVKIIDDNTFYNLHCLNTVYLPASLTKIGVQAFAGSGISKVVFAENGNLTQIGEKAFGYSSVKEHDGSSYSKEHDYYVNIKNIVLPEGLESIGKYAFSNSPLETVAFPASLKIIQEQAFYNCPLSSVTFAENCQLETIEASVFSLKKNITEWDLSNCVALKTIGTSAFANNVMSEFTVPATVETLSSSAFYNCKNLQHIYFAKNDEGKSALKTIDANCFSNTGLVEFTFPTSTSEKIVYGSSIFNGCKNLATVTLSDSVPDITGLFALCYSVQKLVVPETNPNLKVDENAPLVLNLDSNGNATRISLAFGPIPTDASGTYRIPDGITEISLGAFKNQKGIKNLILPSSLVTIGANAFENCLNLETVEFDKPNEANLEMIFANAFKNCASLKSIAFGKSIKRIGNSAFYYCNKLTSVNLEGVEYIGEKAFCESGLTSLTLPTTLKYESAKSNIDTNSTYNAVSAFAGCLDLASITIPDGVTWLSNAMFANSAITEITIPSSVTTLYGTGSTSAISGYGSSLFYGCASLQTANINYNISSATGCTYMFYKCTALKTVTFGTGANTLVNYMFSDCTALEEIDLTGVTTLGTYSFQNCTALTDVTLGGSIVALTDNTFSGCTSLETVDLTGVSTIGKNVFINCTALNKIDLTGVTSLGDSVFSGCSDLSDVTFGTGVTAIGKETFKNCTSLATIDLTGLTTFGVNMFDGCTSLSNVTLEDSATQLSSNMFLGCTALKTITLPSSLTYMNTNTFKNSGLTSITIPDNVAVLGSNADVTKAFTSVSGVNLFLGCKNLTTVILPYNLNTIGAYAFQDCSSLTTVKYKDADGNVVGKDGEVTFSPNLLRIGAKAFSGSGVTKVVITSAIDLAKNLFQDCVNLQSVEIYAGIGAWTGTTTSKPHAADAFTLANSLFTGCTSLSDVIISDKIVKIDTSAFENCKALKTVKRYDETKEEGKQIIGNVNEVLLPADLTTLNSKAFSATGIEFITIPVGITNLGTSVSTANNVFLNCASLRTVNLHEKFTGFGKETFKGCVELAEVNVFDEEGNAVKSCVTLVGNNAFQNTKLKSIDLSSLTTLGTNAFDSCSLLESVVLNDNLSALAANAFSNTANLATIQTYISADGGVGTTTGETGKVTLPSKLTNIGNKAFQNSGITSIDLSAVTTLGTNVFDGCTSLNTVTLNDELTALGNYTFKGCAALTSIKLPSKLTTTGTNTFQNSGLTGITIPAEVTAIGANMFDGCSDLATVTFEGDLIAINDSAFLGCSGLTSITLPSTLKTIGINSFFNCLQLTSVTIPASVTSIGVNAFGGATAISFNGESASYISQDGAVLTKDGKLVNISATITGEWVIPEGVTGIAGYVFNGKNITSVTLPASLASIDAYAFKDFSGALDFSKVTKMTQIVSNTFNGYNGTSIVLPKCITTLAANAFDSCGITEIKLPTEMDSIGNYAFKNCSNLTTIVMPEKLKTLGTYAFQSCTKLESASVPEGVTALGAGIFKDCTSLTDVSLPSTLETLSGTSGNEIFVNCAITKVVFPAKVTKLYQIFNNCSQLQSITFPVSLTSLNLGSGYKNELTEVIIPEGATVMPSLTSCPKLTSIVIPSSVETVASLSGCAALSSVTIKEGVKKLADNAFKNCIGLTEITIPSSVTTIGKNAFEGTGLTEITIPSTVTSLGEKAFLNCLQLQKVTHTTGDAPMVTGSNTFDGCIALQTVKLGGNVATTATVTGLSSYMFQNCTALKTVELSEGISKIGSSTFSGCVSLTSINIPLGVTIIENGAFDNCTSLMTLTLPASIDKVNKSFVGWTKEQKVIFEVYAYDDSTCTTYWLKDADFVYEIVCVNPVYIKTETPDA